MSADATVTVAAFDFDETLTDRDSVIPFLRRAAGTGRVLVGLSARPHRVLPALVRRDRDALRRTASSVAFTGMAVMEFAGHAVEFGHHLVSNRLRPDTVARLRWHRAQGHRVVIVSASYHEYVQVVADHLDVEAVLATRLEVGLDGRLTGRLDGLNCRADEKVRRLQRWMEAAGLSRPEVTLWAYGDSAGDRQMLAWADHPVWVGEPIASVPATS